jgi:hypothetical protein
MEHCKAGLRNVSDILKHYLNITKALLNLNEINLLYSKYYKLARLDIKVLLNTKLLKNLNISKFSK